MLLSIVSRVLRLGQDLPLVKHCEYALLSKQLKPLSTVLDCIRLTKHWPWPVAATHCTCHVTNCTCNVTNCSCRVTHCTCHVTNCTCNVTHCTCHVTNCSCRVTHCTCHVTTIESLIGETVLDWLLHIIANYYQPVGSISLSWSMATQVECYWQPYNPVCQCETRAFKHTTQSRTHTITARDMWRQQSHKISPKRQRSPHIKGIYSG